MNDKTINACGDNLINYETVGANLRVRPIFSVWRCHTLMSYALSGRNTDNKKRLLRQPYD
jgi:hypothetical protein